MGIFDDVRVTWLSVFQVNGMFLGNDQDMRRRLRVYVFNIDALIFIMDLLRTCLAAADTAELAIRYIRSPNSALVIACVWYRRNMLRLYTAAAWVRSQS
jgi:hypothetical protein